ncbi:glycoside hydrolase family 19 protein [Pseudomonas sp. LB3P14]
MSTGLLEQRANYPHSQYEYGPAKGYADADADGRKEIDCSGLLYRMLKDAGYSIPYLTTGQLTVDVTHFDVIPLASVEPGDIALWINFHGHTGVVEDINAVRTAGNFFGSQSSTGPKSAKYGHQSGYWPMPEKFLRPKAQYKTGAQPAPAAAPAPAPAPAGPAPLMNFQYPFRKADGKQFTDAEEVYKALEGETSGHYLLGSNKFWHGGIHISDLSAPQCVLHQPVRCMADGEVVAYRLNKDYLTSTFGEGVGAKFAKYTNSFCLVRHEYKSPPNPEEGANKGKQNTLTFYSLYMHLLPFARYPLSPEETPNQKIKMLAGGFTARSDAKGEPGCQSYGAIAAGTEFEILDKKGTDEIYAKGKILKGNVVGRSVGQEVWFAYKKNGEVYPRSSGGASWSEILPPQRGTPNYWQGKVKARVGPRALPLFGAPASPGNGQNAGAPIGSMALTVSSVVEFDSEKVVNLNIAGKLRRMAECTLVSGGLAGAGTVPPTFWASVENELPEPTMRWETVTPADVAFDEVTLTSTGIKAGDPIGYLGLMENVSGEGGDVTRKHQVHVEIFTADTKVEGFLQNLAGLKIGKQFLRLPAGTVLNKKAPQTGTVQLLKEHVVELSKAPIFKDPAEWYELKVDEDGQSKTGLIKKADAQVITQHDWEKLGFRIVKESSAGADGFLDPDDMPDLFKALYNDLDRLGNHDGKVTPEDFPEALKNIEMRDHWSKLIAYHPTEWKDKSEEPKWSRLAQILENSPKSLKHESARIDKFVFWSKLSGRAEVPADGMVWHFHPIEIIRNFSSVSSELISKDQMKSMFPTSSESKREEVRGLFNKYAERFEINTPARISQFFAQVKTEVGAALVGKSESLWYSVPALKSLFKRYFDTYPAEAEQLGYKRIEMAQYNALSPAAKSAYTLNGGKAYSQLPKPDEIAKRVYCCCSASGNFVLTSGGCAEGLSYKGKGFIQLTWKANYKAVEDVLKAKLPEETIDIVANPDQLLDTKTGLLSAMGFWEWQHLNNKVAPNVESTDNITKIVNLKTESYAERRTHFTEIYQVFSQ